MRIGIDAHLVKAQPTGVGKAITRTIEAMVGASDGDEFVVYGNREFPAVLDAKANCRVVRSPFIAGSRVLRVLHERFRMPGHVLRDHVDVFYAPGYVFPGDVLVPMVLGIFDVNALKSPGRVRPETARYYRIAMPAAAQRASRIVAPTRVVAGEIEALLEVPGERIRVVPLAADERFRKPPGGVAGVKGKYGIDSSYILFVGNIEPNKNLSRLVQAFFAARLNKRLPHRLVLVGKKRHRATRLAALIRQLGCEEQVVFTGYAPDEDLPALYSGADLFVYPSHAEGFGIPPLEAMLCGTPVVTSEDGAVVEVTGDGALHVPAGELAALRQAIEKVLMEKRFAAELARRGREVAQRYDWAETGRQTLAIIREAAGERR